MDIVRSLPSTMGGLSAWCLAIGAAILLIFRALKPAMVLAIIGGIGMAGMFGQWVSRVISGGSQAASTVTSTLFGAAVPALFFIITGLLVYKYGFQGGGGGGGALVGAGRGRGKGRGGLLGGGGLGGGGRGGGVKTHAKNWALFTGAAALGAAIGTIPFVFDWLNRAVGAVHSAAVGLVS